ncbi:hypothetical protein PNOK_0844100 [Pyrrhoderma noxium]|uniref:Uncharacterized protein n=1 Tax=Pyrrhoderma noxium TaxID=2282107 RepID=A0A286U7M5_9AGAM|nr:hypothetical protein PNOK_0844100 [Pyrrhoderma noxium]
MTRYRLFQEFLGCSFMTLLIFEISTNQITQLKFDQLGPMVVNSDGTLSHITNWENMTEPERERTIRVLNARNRLRLAQEKEKTEDPSETVTLTGP